MSGGPIVLAFSGGLDTCWCVPHLIQEMGALVVTVTVDVGGFSPAELRELERRSRALGASQHVCVEARQPFFQEVLRPLIFGNVLRGHLYPLCVGAERGLQAREVARVARQLGARAVAHGCTAAGNDQVRFEMALMALVPNLPILAPIRDQAPSRTQEMADLRRLGLPDLPQGGRYSINAGLWGVTIGGVETLSSSASLPEEAWVRTRGAFLEPREPLEILLGFEKGVPCSLDGEVFAPVALIQRLDRLAGSFGIGRGLHLGDTLLGAKGRVAFEAPAATLLITAHRELEKLCLTREQQRVKDQLAASYGELLHGGHGHERICRDIEAFFKSTQARVSGAVRLLLRPGSLFVQGVSSPHSLLAASRSLYGEEARDWTPADARGFSRLAALPGILEARVAELQAAP